MSQDQWHWEDIGLMDPLLASVGRCETLVKADGRFAVALCWSKRIAAYR